MTIQRAWVLIGVTLMSATAWAEDGEASDDLVYDNGFVIEGEVQRPEVEVMIQRENLQKGFELELKESFLPRIIEVLKEEPF